MAEKLFTAREASHVLGVSEGEILELAKKGEVPAYLLGGEFIRFNQEHIQILRKKLKKEKSHRVTPPKRFDKIKDFFYFYDFYLVSSGIIILLVYLILKS